MIRRMWSQILSPANVEALFVAGMVVGWLTLQTLVLPALGVPT